MVSGVIGALGCTAVPHPCSLLYAPPAAVGSYRQCQTGPSYGPVDDVLAAEKYYPPVLQHMTTERQLVTSCDHCISMVLKTSQLHVLAHTDNV